MILDKLNVIFPILIPDPFVRDFDPAVTGMNTYNLREHLDISLESVRTYVCTSSQVDADSLPEKIPNVVRMCRGARLPPDL